MYSFRARTRRSVSLPNDPVGPSFTLALWWQRGATKQALLRITRLVFGYGHAALGAMQASHGNCHACFHRSYSGKGSCTMSGFFAASSRYNKCLKSAKLIAVHPAVPPRS